jgi:hypothetical protein
MSNRNAGVPPAGAAASRRRPSVGSAQVTNQRFGGGSRVAARDAVTPAGGDAGAPGGAGI